MELKKFPSFQFIKKIYYLSKKYITRTCDLLRISFDYSNEWSRMSESESSYSQTFNIVKICIELMRSCHVSHLIGFNFTGFDQIQDLDSMRIPTLSEEVPITAGHEHSTLVLVGCSIAGGWGIHLYLHRQSATTGKIKTPSNLSVKVVLALKHSFRQFDCLLHQIDQH